jgi:hypothetical protein
MMMMFLYGASFFCGDYEAKFLLAFSSVTLTVSFPMNLFIDDSSFRNLRVD